MVKPELLVVLGAALSTTVSATVGTCDIVDDVFDTFESAAADFVGYYTASISGCETSVAKTETCVTQAQNGLDDANAFYGAIESFGTNLMLLSQCSKTVEFCTHIDNVDDESCTCTVERGVAGDKIDNCDYYDCSRMMLYYTGATEDVDGLKETTCDENGLNCVATIDYDDYGNKICTEDSRADCAVYNAGISLGQAYDECMDAYDTLCVMNRDLAWYTFDVVCDAWMSYQECDGASLLDVCADGDDDCNKAMSNLDFCMHEKDVDTAALRQTVADIEASSTAVELNSATNGIGNVAKDASVGTAIGVGAVMGCVGLFVGFKAGQQRGHEYQTI